MWAVTCELRQPDLFSALPGPGRPAWADFPSARLWAGAYREVPASLGWPSEGWGLKLHPCSTSPWKAFWSRGEETRRALSHNRIPSTVLGASGVCGNPLGPHAVIWPVELGWKHWPSVCTLYTWEMLILKLAASLPSPRDLSGHPGAALSVLCPPKAGPEVQPGGSCSSASTRPGQSAWWNGSHREAGLAACLLSGCLQGQSQPGSAECLPVAPGQGSVESQDHGMHSAGRNPSPGSRPCSDNA